MAEKKKERPLYRKIVNGFMTGVVVIIALALIAFGFSQTETFHNYLKNEIQNRVNSSISGKLTIGELDGTVFTSLILRDVCVSANSDTLLFAKKIESVLNPAQLALNKIYLRKIEIEDVLVNLSQDSTNRWNIDKLLTKEKTYPNTVDISNTPDSIDGNFPYLIQIVSAKLSNLKFIRKSNEFRDSSSVMKYFNTDNLIIDSVYFGFSLVADLNRNEFAATLNNLSANSNFGGFKLRELSGLLHVTDSFAEVKGLKLVTGRSAISINARLDSLNLFAPVIYKNFKEFPVKLDLLANSFNFDDLSSFLEATKILSGKADLELALEGLYGGFDIKKLLLNYGDSQFDIIGKMKNLNIPEHLYMDLQFNQSSAGMRDVAELLPQTGIPTFDGLTLNDFNGIYKGEPTDFYTEIRGGVDGGMIDTKAKLNVAESPMTYDISAVSQNLDIQKIIGVPTRINSTTALKGKGTSPAEIFSDLSVKLYDSQVNGYSLDSLNLTAALLKRKFNLNFEGKVNDAQISSRGLLEFPIDSPPRYNLTGGVKSLDISRFTDDSTTFSSLNFLYDFNGQSFKLDSMSGEYTLTLAPSIYNEYLLDESEIKLLLKSDSLKKEINLTSRFVDVNIDGDFSLDEAIKISSYQGITISQIIGDKIHELNPLNILEEDTTDAGNLIRIPDYTFNDLYVNYNFNFKDFDIIGKVIGAEKLNISGGGEGTIRNDSANFSISTRVDLDYLIDHSENTSFYISGVHADFDFNRRNGSQSFENFFGSLSFNGKRIYTGTELQDISADLVFNGSKIFFNNSFIADSSLSTQFDGIIFMKPAEQEIVFENFDVIYKDIDWKLREPVSLFFNPTYLNLYGLKLFHNDASVQFNGYIRSSGVQDVFVTIDDLPASLLGNYFSPETDFIAGNIEAYAQMNGTLSDPIINAHLDMFNVTYSGVPFGALYCDADYSNKLMNISLNFIDSTSSGPVTLIKLDGFIPIDLSLVDAGERLINDEDLDLQLYSNKLDIKLFADLLPLIRDQRGLLTADVDIGGNYENINYDGFLSLANASFVARANNLTYNAGLNFKLDHNKIEIDSLTVTNAGGSQYSGTINGTGILEFDGFALDSADVSIIGDLALLGPASNTGETNYSGNLLVGTDNAWKLTYNNDAWLLKGIVLLKRTDVTYKTNETNSGLNSASFNYKIIEDSTNVDREQIRYETYLQDINSQGLNTQSGNATQFNYDVLFRMEQIGNIQFIFSQLANQKLDVEATGEIKFEKNNSRSIAQGEFVLLEGSKLEFFKTFAATGKIRFESELSNPFLDVVATYTGDYTDPASESGATEEVAVKIILNSPLNEIGQKFAANSDNILVYKGARNIQDNVNDSRYDAADALSFVLVGKFKDDLTAGDKTAAAYQTSVLTNTATSLLGSVLSNYVNSALGDIVNNIQLSNSSNVDKLKFNVSGRIQNIRYRIGGTTEVFNDIYKADLRIEYLFSPHFLIRVERKRPVIETYGVENKINELGLKYKFIF